jgi:hypothetical protein
MKQVQLYVCVYRCTPVHIGVYRYISVYIGTYRCIPACRRWAVRPENTLIRGGVYTCSLHWPILLTNSPYSRTHHGVGLLSSLHWLIHVSSSSYDMYPPMNVFLMCWLLSSLHWLILLTNSSHSRTHQGVDFCPPFTDLSVHISVYRSIRLLLLMCSLYISIGTYRCLSVHNARTRPRTLDTHTYIGVYR